MRHPFPLVTLAAALSLHLSVPSGPVAGTPSEPDWCAVWVLFADKSAVAPATVAGPRALSRRARAGFASSSTDWPVRRDYIREVERLGGRLRHEFKWANAASFEVPRTRLGAIADKPFVRRLLPVSVYTRKYSAEDAAALRKGMAAVPGQYGVSYSQLNMISVPAAHDYLSRIKGRVPGAGVLVAFFDSGFWLRHACFSYMRTHGGVYATRDFIDRDSTVHDPDSVRTNPLEPYYGNDGHGTQTLSLVAGYDPSYFAGVAWGSQFVLARTEDTYLLIDSGEERECHTEEDNWAAAAVWAESLGVDVISSSLGYRDGFRDTIVIDRNGSTDTIVDYTYEDLDGKTTIVSLAAKYAVERGILVVNAMGNEGSNREGTLTAPADVDGVIAVGAIDRDSMITYFSSTGPTADGRIKPDLVALGMSVEVAEPSGPQPTSYSPSGTGTSFSTPLVAGICALVKQSHPGLTGERLRARLFASCSLLPDQDSIDNFYGRGLPDALLACLDTNMVHITARDSLGNPLPGVQVLSLEGNVLGTTDSMGVAIITSDSGSLTLSVRHSAGFEQRVNVRKLPARHVVVFNFENSLVVRVRDSRDSIVTAAQVYFKQPGQSEFVRKAVDGGGSVRFVYYSSGAAQVYATSPGYLRSTLHSIHLKGATCTLTVIMEDRPVPRFEVYPTVLNVGRDKQKLKVEFLASEDDPRDYSQELKASVWSSDGQLVWRSYTIAEEFKPVRLEWDCRTRNHRLVIPGIYFFVLEYGGKIYRRKFLIAG